MLIKIKKNPRNKISFLFQLKTGIFSLVLTRLIAGSSAGFFWTLLQYQMLKNTKIVVRITQTIAENKNPSEPVKWVLTFGLISCWKATSRP
jgi:hypothetical protein